jgi:hypothetical protein
VIDVMPGYRYGQLDQLRTTQIRATTEALPGVSSRAVWFEDVVVSTTEDNRKWVFRQRFAVDGGLVVYSEQCLSPKVCLSLRPLPPEESK